MMKRWKEIRIGQLRGSVPFAVVVSCALWAMTPQVRAADQGITGKQLLLKSTPKLIVLSKDPGISITGSDPVGSDSSITFDDGTNTATWDLPAGNWTKNSSGTLFKYNNGSAPSGPSAVKIAKLKSGLLKVVAKGLPIPVLTGAATVNVVLSLDGGTNTYCMTFAGMGDGSMFLVKDAAAGTCPTTTVPTPSTTPTPTATPMLDLPNITPPGPAPLRYRDLVFAAASTTSNVTYGSAVNFSGQTVTLLLDIYEPTGDTITARPAIVWVHGGSFCCGDKTSGEHGDEAHTFARKGYFNVSINYRVEPGGCSASGGIPSSACIAAIREAREDAQTAVRFLRTNAATYGIDGTRIAVAGSSAGAITAVNVACNSSEDPTAAVGGAVSLSGARLFSGGALDAGDAPLLLFPGTADTVVPYQWAVDTWNQALGVGLDAFLTSWSGFGHVPYAAHRTEIIDQTTNFLYWEMDLTTAAQ